MNAMTQLPQLKPSPETVHMDTYDARDLIKDGVQVCLTLDQQVYYLRITRSGKLILTK
ncbi:hemin uptake protein HemP [Actibacterium sp. 188UL27-1]|uniref:hemin uptake protein HemP n=1 Tax=Actibacterium sp. 188UL27-1 TaxID=2786961 RepID=UPI00195E79F7|nr:hemin uptake protein HemP [Actibacterium sp. 188UL27-1]MBM7067254.1 hemin uptake protein HemP [Actibacterium sp. 188UL27-1]